MRSPEVQAEEQALRDLSTKMQKLRLELDAMRRQYDTKRKALEALNVPGCIRSPSDKAQATFRKNHPAEYDTPTDAHGCHFVHGDYARHVKRGYYGTVSSAYRKKGVVYTVLHLQCTADGRPYRKPLIKSVPSSDLEHVYHIPFRLGCPA